ncbi:MAG: DUF362 domain-containing protein [Candidatus Aenigmatarchaeota archaeon]
MLKSLEKLYQKIENGFDVKGKKVAIKVHFGEKGNKTHLDPDFAKKICEIVRDRGGKPELIECNTLYKGERLESERHIALAKNHGFDFAPIVICDSVKDWEIEIDGKHFKKIKVGGLLKNYDLMIALTHSKGHILAGYGGALKNVGMGLGSRAGKLEMHAKVKPIFNQKKCKACGICEKNCPGEAILVDKFATMDEAKCIGCANCIAVCPYNAVEIPWESATSEELQERIVEYAWGITQKIKTIYFNFLLNITPRCDCVANSGRRMVDDIGILASKDIVAIDQASIDMIIKKAGRNVFKEVNKIDPYVQTSYAEFLGIGERKYKIVKV